MSWCHYDQVCEVSVQVCKIFHGTISSSNAYWNYLTGTLMTARFLAPKGYFTNSTFTSFHKLIHDLVLCRDCGAFADWPAGQKVCKYCCQVCLMARTFYATPVLKMIWISADDDKAPVLHLILSAATEVTGVACAKRQHGL